MLSSHWKSIWPSDFNSTDMNIDGTNFPIQEPLPFSSEWYSYKLNYEGFRCKVGLSIYSGDLVWANGPYKPGEFTDVMFFRDKLKYLLRRIESFVADNIYRDKKWARKGHFTGPEGMKVKRILFRYEIINSRFKQFVVLRMPFRNDISVHSAWFSAVLYISKAILDHENSPLIFDAVLGTTCKLH